MPLKRKSKKNKANRGRRSTKGGRSNPSHAYRGEQTYRHKFQAVYHLVGATAGGFVESVNLGVVDDFSILASQWAVWRIRNFTVKIMPTTSGTGAYSARPFEPIDATPVTPTNIASVMDGGGVMRACTNFDANIVRLRWRSRQLNSDTFTSTSSTTNNNFGDPGWMLYCTGTAFEFYIQVNITFEFREAVQYATKSPLKEARIGEPPLEDDSDTEVVSIPLVRKQSQNATKKKS